MNGVHLLESDLDLNLLRVLVALLQEGSATGAARRLGISQSAVSHALARLRTALDDPLFVRSGSGLQPTPRAEALAARLPQLLGELGGLLLGERGFEPRSSERVFRLAATDYGQLVLLPRLGQLLAQSAPATHLVIHQLERSVVAALEGGEVELAIGNFRQVPTALRRQALFEERFVCMLRRGHPRVKSRLTLKAFTEVGHVLIAPMGKGGGIVDEALQRCGAPPRHIALTLPSFLVAPLIVAESDLLLTLPERVARLYADTLPVRVVAPPLALPTFTVSQLWHERLQADAGHAFLRRLVASAAGGRAWQQ